MKMILAMTAMAISLAASGATTGEAMAQTETLTPATEDWNPFSRSAVKVYMADVNSFIQTGNVIGARVAKVPLGAQPGDYGYATDQIEVRCSTKQSRLVFSIEYGPDGVQTDRFDEPEEWATYAPETRDAYLAQLVCDGDRTTTSWPSIKAFIDAGRP